MHLSLIYINLILPIMLKFPSREKWSNQEHLIWSTWSSLSWGQALLSILQKEKAKVAAEME